MHVSKLAYAPRELFTPVRAEAHFSHLTISSEKQPLILLMCSCRTDPGSALSSCTRFSPPLVTNKRRDLLSWGSTSGRWGRDGHTHTQENADATSEIRGISRTHEEKNWK